MKKRFLSINLSLVLLLQVIFFGTCYSAENSISEETEQPCTETTVLNEIDIIPSFDIENQGDCVSRVQFAEYAFNALLLSEVKNKLYFKDISVDHWANGIISAMVEAGIIDAADDNRFNPEDPITPEQAYKIMLCGLGYKTIAQYEGAGLSGYYATANKTGISIVTESKDRLSLNEAARIIFNSMKIGYAQVKANSPNEIREINKDDTLFEARKIRFGTGRVNAVYGKSVFENTTVQETNQLYIENEKFVCSSSVNVYGLFGREVEFLYKEADVNEKNVIYAQAVDEMLSIEGKLIKSFDENSGSLSYYKTDDAQKVSTITIPSKADIIYNGHPYGGRLFDLFNEFMNEIKDGRVKFIKNDGDYKTIIIESYKTVIASGYNETRMVYFDKFSADGNVDLSAAETIRYISPEGIETNAPTVYPTILDVSMSDDKTSAEIIVCDKQVSGKISIVYNDDKTIQIDDEKYEVTDKAWKKFASSLRVGTEIVAKLNSFNDVAYIEAAAGGMQIGYLMDTTVCEDGFDNEFKFKLFANGSVNVYSLADKVKLDEIKYDMTKYKDFFINFPKVDSIENSSGIALKIKPQIIRFTLNKDGKISEIDSTNCSVNEDAENSLQMKHDGKNSLIYNHSIRRFGMDTLYNTSRTSVFVIPSGISDDNTIDLKGIKISVEDGMYSTSPSFRTDYSYNLVTYNFDKTNPYTDVIVTEEKPLVQDDHVYMFNCVKTVLNSENEVVPAIECYSSNGIKDVEIYDSLKVKADSLKKGDLIVFDMDFQYKKAYGLERYFKIEDMYFDDTSEFRTTTNPYWHHGDFNEFGSWAFRTTGDTNRQLTKVYPYEFVGSVLNTSYEYSYLADKKITESVNTSNIPIIVYDSKAMREDRRIRQGSSADIDTYEKVGLNCSTVVIAYSGLDLKCIFVYN